MPPNPPGAEPRKRRAKSALDDNPAVAEARLLNLGFGGDLGWREHLPGIHYSELSSPRARQAQLGLKFKALQSFLARDVSHKLMITAPAGAKTIKETLDYFMIHDEEDVRELAKRLHGLAVEKKIFDCLKR